jgi:hypothetical protein
MSCRKRTYLRLVVIALITGSLLLTNLTVTIERALAAPSGTLLEILPSDDPDADASYPRAIRLDHDGEGGDTVLATFAKRNRGTPNAPSTLPIYRSEDGGVTWSTTPISTIEAHTVGPGGRWDIEGPVLYEVPYTANGLQAGDILAAGTAWDIPDFNAQKVEVHKSTDHGATWDYLSTCTEQSGGGSGIGHGIWEPWFIQTEDGTLACFISDERPAGESINQQKIVHYTSTNGGASWGTTATNVVASSNPYDRPGMSILTRLPNDDYLMTYELCRDGVDPDHACEVRIKTSSDGLTWNASALGTLAETADDRHLLHTPYVAWTPVGGPNGTVLLSGQRVVSGPTGSKIVEPESGRVVFANTNLGQGDWTEIAAPLTIDPTGGYSNPSTIPSCPGYSSPIVPSKSGNSILYFAGVWAGSGVRCEVRFAHGGVGNLPLYAPLDGGRMDGFTTYGGNWQNAAGGVLQSTDVTVAGARAVTGNSGWSNYTVTTDIRLDTSGQAGMVLRHSDPSLGADSNYGYFAGIVGPEYNADGSLRHNGELILGRQFYGYQHLATPQAVVGGVQVGTWYRLTATVYGCSFRAALRPVTGNHPTTVITGTHTNCYPSGMVALRSQLTEASFRGMSVLPAPDAADGSYHAPFAANKSNWVDYGGSWGVDTSGRALRNTSGGDGEKSTNTSFSYNTIALTGDVRLDSSTGPDSNAGLLGRVSSPAVGVDAVNGYYVGVNATGNDLVLGRLNRGSPDIWTPLATKDMPADVVTGQWYHLTLSINACTVTATAQETDSWDRSRLSVTDTGCTVATGGVGVRTFDATARWRDLVLIDH